MAIKMISNYSKKLGLPGFSSHQFSVSLETELVTTDDVAREAARLYQLLQSSVDGQILTTGFVPPYDYGMEPAETNGSPAPNASANGPSSASTLAAVIAAAIASANGSASNTGNGTNWQRGQEWKCSDKQRDLILKLVDEHQLDKHTVEALAVERFGKGVRMLNKIEASGLIDELLDTHGGNNGQGSARRRNGSAYQNNGRRPAA